MKRLLIFLFILDTLGGFAQVPISQLPAYNGNPAAGAVPVVILGTTRKLDPGYFGFNHFDSVVVKSGTTVDTFRFYNKFTGSNFTLLYTKPAGAVWGTITGTLSGQTDLQTALNAKQNSLGYTAYDAANPSGYITASSSSVLTNKSGNISQWTNDAAYLTTIGAGSITNAMLAGSIAYSKLSLTGAILNGDLAGSIAYSKLSLSGAILNTDLAGSIAYSKLSLSGAILNTDLAGSIDLTTKVTGILPAANGGTGNGFFAVTGPTTSLRTFTFPNANATIARTDASNTFTGAQTFSTSPVLSSLTDDQLLYTVSGTVTGSTNFKFVHSTGQIQYTFPAIGTTVSTSKGMYMVNNTVAGAGAQQFSPIIIQEGTGWKTTATAASVGVDMFMYVAPVQGTTAPTFKYNWDGLVQGGSVTNMMNLNYNGTTANLSVTGGVITGAVTTGYVEKTGDYAIGANDHTVNLTSGSHTFTLPTAVGIAGQEYIFKNTGGGTLTEATTSSQTIDGSAPGTVSTVKRYKSTGANWITW